jgi:hypothetical protein
VLPGNHAARCTEPHFACLLALLFFEDYKTRSRMKLAERIPGPKALPVLGKLLDLMLYFDRKLH